MDKKSNSHEIKINRGRKILFSAILLFIPIVILCAIEIFLRIINYGDDVKLFIDLPGEELQKHRVINPKIGKKYFHTLTYSTPCHDMFLKKKPENGFRIFVLGSSTVLGFPYDENLMFTRVLQERLQDSYPDKKIKVINTALTAINSLTLLDFSRDVFKEEPDVILIYAGHNEFYGALGVGSLEKISPGRSLTILHLNLLSSRFYQLLRNIIAKTGRPEQKESGTLMKIIAENFLKFLKALDRKYRNKKLYIIADNLSVHKHKDVKDWLKSKRKIQCTLLQRIRLG